MNFQQKKSENSLHLIRVNCGIDSYCIYYNGKSASPLINPAKTRFPVDLVRCQESETCFGRLTINL